MFRTTILSAALMLSAALAFAQQPAPAAKPAKPPMPGPSTPVGPLKNQKDKVSYSIGLDIGRNFKNQGIDVDPNLLARGMRDALAGSKPLLSDEEIHQVMTDFQMAMREQQVKKQQAVGDKNAKDGAAFLASNKGKDGVKTTASGLEYKVIKEGTGKVPTTADTVKAHYRGTLLDGTEFDSSYKRGEPAEFPVSGVIAGWTEVLQLMHVGSKYQVWIPSSLAYGERGAGQVIGPNAMLTFEIELLDVQKPQ